MKINIKDYQPAVQAWLANFRDIRFTGQVVFVIIVLLLSWSGVKTIQTNYVLQKQIAGLQQKNDLLKLQNQNQKLQNQYYGTDTFLELQARQNFGLGRPGEKEILVPEAVALANAPSLPEDNAAKAVTKKQPSNFESWMNFFLHRQPLER
jgi:cell division protein FtsB